MKADKIIKELEANYGYKFERDYFLKFKEYKKLIDDIKVIVQINLINNSVKNAITKLAKGSYQRIPPLSGGSDNMLYIFDEYELEQFIDEIDNIIKNQALKQ